MAKGEPRSNGSDAVGTHRDLAVWQEAMKLVSRVYAETADFPQEEMFGLKTQLRRAAVSVPRNIAEGAARAPLKEFKHLLVIARGSLAELETQTLIAENLGHIPEVDELVRQIRQVLMLLNGLISSTTRSKA